jgi:hypothetical protein
LISGHDETLSHRSTSPRFLSPMALDFGMCRIPA